MAIEAGQRFGSLVVMSAERGAPKITCRCDCGTVKDFYRANVTRGLSRSCGKHGHGQAAHPLYKQWSHMMDRCHNETSKDYPNWGGRGIRVCPEWRDPRAFIEYVERELGPRPEGFTFDRIDNNGNYEPGNVRWASRATQSRNKRGGTNSASRYKGVTLEAGKCRAGIRVDGRLHHLGIYVEEIEAAMVYDLAALAAWGDDAVLNFTSSRN